MARKTCYHVEAVRARKIVIHCGRNRHATNSPRSEASSCHKEQDLTTSNDTSLDIASWYIISLQFVQSPLPPSCIALEISFEMTGIVLGRIKIIFELSIHWIRLNIRVGEPSDASCHISRRIKWCMGFNIMLIVLLVKALNFPGITLFDLISKT
ncbi:hypothetical protein Syun_031512 [Stephania yunnanensis]|uniref:Uncharacterized protein n=1 Tax=Stephania yunnanensis TaxID=152371 RepID=A0AAP0E3U6_9MAGN